jgi:hypothetical protein
LKNWVRLLEGLVEELDQGNIILRLRIGPGCRFSRKERVRLVGFSDEELSKVAAEFLEMDW